MKFMAIEPGEQEHLASWGDLPKPVHVFDLESIQALNAALAARRPLLVRGEPGIGKSQLARAAAKHLDRAYIQHVVDARTESRDLLWHFDAVARLADAQVYGAICKNIETVHQKLELENYIRPGPLWWAFAWDDAERIGYPAPDQPDGGNPKNGCVVLVDEIDKAETDVPNGLLEALGTGQFTPLGRKQPVIAAGVSPLVIITTNEERALPDAFVRRCLVLYLTLPQQDDALIELLVERGRAHFDTAEDGVLAEAARLLARDRKKARDEHWLPLPGQAEYLDLVRAVLALAPGDPDKQRQTLEKVARYTLRKHKGVSA